MEEENLAIGYTSGGQVSPGPTPTPSPLTPGNSPPTNLPVPADPPAGPCQWEMDVSCDPRWATYPPAVQQRALNIATEILWAFTGHRFGLCPVTIRPCRQPIRCGTIGYSWGGWGPYGTNMVLNPYIGADGLWRNGCGGCGSECGCNVKCIIRMQGPIYKITQIIQNGAVVPDTDWVLYNKETVPLLVRVQNGCWIVGGGGMSCMGDGCQELVQPDDGPQALAIDFLKGTPVPYAGRAAGGVLASEIARLCTNQACRLPTRVSSIVREGITMSFIDPLAMFKEMRVGIPEVDMWIASMNPYSIMRPAGIYTPDIQRAWQVGQSNPYPWRGYPQTGTAP